MARIFYSKRSTIVKSSNTKKLLRDIVKSTALWYHGRRGVLGTLDSFHKPLARNVFPVQLILRHITNQCVPPRMHPTQLFISKNPHRPSIKHGIHLFQTPICCLGLKTPRRKRREKTDPRKYDIQNPADIIQGGWDIQGKPKVHKPIHCRCHAIRTASRYHWKDLRRNDPGWRCPTNGKGCDVEI